MLALNQLDISSNEYQGPYCMASSLCSEHYIPGPLAFQYAQISWTHSLTMNDTFNSAFVVTDNVRDTLFYYRAHTLMAVRYKSYKAHYVTRSGWDMDPPEVCLFHGLILSLSFVHFTVLFYQFLFAIFYFTVQFTVFLPSQFLMVCILFHASSVSPPDP